MGTSASAAESREGLLKVLAAAGAGLSAPPAQLKLLAVLIGSLDDASAVLRATAAELLEGAVLFTWQELSSSRIPGSNLYRAVHRPCMSALILTALQAANEFGSCAVAQRWRRAGAWSCSTSSWARQSCWSGWAASSSSRMPSWVSRSAYISALHPFVCQEPLLMHAARRGCSSHRVTPTRSVQMSWRMCWTWRRMTWCGRCFRPPSPPSWLPR